MLSKEQQAAAETTSQNVLVVAGAGSGKTRVLTHRIVHLIMDRDVKPRSIMALTFTRKAANELLRRVSTELGLRGHGNPANALDDMMLGTFHSVSLRIIEEHAELLGFNADRLTVLEPEDQDRLLGIVSRDLNFHKKYSASKIKSILDKVYTGQIGFDDLHRDAQILFGEYRSRLKSYNALDFGTMLAEVVYLFEKFPDIKQAYHERIRHVLVDELQDTDKVQLNLLRQFAPPASFFGVGDFRQSVYGWRGAVPHVTMGDVEAETHYLTECYRCPPGVVLAANKLAHQMDRTMFTPMVAMKDYDVPSILTLKGGSQDLLAFIEHEIHDGRGFAWRDIAIICRTHGHQTNRDLRRLGQLCEENKIPYRHVGASFDICKTAGFQDLHAILKLFLNPKDEISALRLTPSYSELEWEGYGHHPDTKIYTILQLIKEMFPGHRFPAAFWHAAQFWLNNCRHSTLSGALRWFAARDSQTDLEGEPEDEITLITAHGAKGLEWSVVVVANCQEGTFPTRRAIRAGDVEEERRVFYVACTRASKLLAVHYRGEDDLAATGPRDAPSRFLREMEVI